MPGVKNYSVLVKEQKGRIAFLRKIVAGAADKSYGIHVAELAGLPAPVVERAREILSNLEEGEFTDGGQPALASKRPKNRVHLTNSNFPSSKVKILKLFI